MLNGDSKIKLLSTEDSKVLLIEDSKIKLLSAENSKLLHKKIPKSK